LSPHSVPRGSRRSSRLLQLALVNGSNIRRPIVAARLSAYYIIINPAARYWELLLRCVRDAFEAAGRDLSGSTGPRVTRRRQSPYTHEDSYTAPFRSARVESINRLTVATGLRPLNRKRKYADVIVVVVIAVPTSGLLPATHSDGRRTQGRLNQWAHLARAQGPRFFSF